MSKLKQSELTVLGEKIFVNYDQIYFYRIDDFDAVEGYFFELIHFVNPKYSFMIFARRHLCEVFTLDISIGECYFLIEIVRDVSLGIVIVNDITFLNY